MIEEAIVSILAAAKIGAIQTIIFSGYSSESLQIRLQDCHAKILLTSDGFHRKGKSISQKIIVETATENTDVEKIIVFHTKELTNMRNQKKFNFMIHWYLIKVTLVIPKLWILRILYSFCIPLELLENLKGLFTHMVAFLSLQVTRHHIGRYPSK